MHRTEENYIGIFKTNTFSLVPLSIGRSSLVQKTKSQDTLAATPPGSNLSYLPVTFKKKINSIHPRRKTNQQKKEPEDIYIASHAVMRNWHLE